ncbi:putative methanogenesis marker protein 2 [Thermoplasmatales archaeon BRNA1]|nr:putative methanogenesis marker protein 2 [Thermoplasmatales archaeon BRNA1]
MAVHDVVEAVRNFPGVTRKAKIHEVVDLLPVSKFPNVIASEGEDAAVIETQEGICTLFAADGIMESLVNSDPYMAGYFAVLVNVNDIAAMGGRATAMVDVMSMEDEIICGRMLRGMEEGVHRFNVPIVGGHTHPDCSYHALDISVIGTVKRSDIVLSSTARDGDDVVMVMDLDGHYPKSIPYAWETTLAKDPKTVQRQMDAAARVAEEHLVHAGKDMSNPGCVGTLGMLLESSEMGAVVDLDAIPAPKGCKDLEDFIHWILSYQGCGFVYTCDPSCSQKVIDIFSKVGCTGAVVGKINSSKRYELVQNGERETLFDFSRDIITGCRPKQHPGYRSE